MENGRYHAIKFQCKFYRNTLFDLHYDHNITTTHLNFPMAGNVGRKRAMPIKKNVATITTESVSNFVFACVKVKLGNIFEGCYFKVSGRRYSMAYIEVCVFLFLFYQLKSHYHSLSVVACCFYWFVRCALLSIPFACWFSGLNFVNSIRILIVTSICHASNFLCFFIDCGDSIKFWLNFDNGVNEHEKIIDQTFSPRLPSENKFN